MLSLLMHTEYILDTLIYDISKKGELAIFDASFACLDTS